MHIHHGERRLTVTVLVPGTSVGASGASESLSPSQGPQKVENKYIGGPWEERVASLTTAGRAS